LRATPLAGPTGADAFFSPPFPLFGRVFPSKSFFFSSGGKRNAYLFFRIIFLLLPFSLCGQHNQPEASNRTEKSTTALWIYL
jgi:hypothetical protein